jgi:predicted small lipoprotein YifL
MKPLLTVLVSVLLVVSVCACGSSSKGTNSSPPASVSSTTSTASSTQQSEKQVDPTKAIVDFGQPASAANRQTIVALVRRYYMAAAAEDGAKACPLIYSLFEEAIAEDYGQPPGPPSLRGKTCPVVMSKLFKQQHKQEATDLATLRVTGVRVDRKRGVVLLSFKENPRRYLHVQLEHGTWKINSLTDVEVP